MLFNTHIRDMGKKQRRKQKKVSAVGKPFVSVYTRQHIIESIYSTTN